MGAELKNSYFSSSALIAATFVATGVVAFIVSLVFILTVFVAARLARC